MRLTEDSELGYQDFITRNGEDAALAVLDIADLLSLRERGYPVRRWRVIQDGAVPDHDDFSDADDPMIERAITMFKRGERGTPLTGKGFEEVIHDLSPRLPEWVPGSARDDYELDLSFDFADQASR